MAASGSSATPYIATDKVGEACDSGAVASGSGVRRMEHVAFVSIRMSPHRGNHLKN